MRKGTSLAASPLFAAMMAVAGAGVITSAAPAQAADCQQWGFPGPVTMRRDTGETVNFTANGPNAGAPAQWHYPNGTKDNGNVNGNIGPDGHFSLTYFENNGTSVQFDGQVGPDGNVAGMSPPDNSVAWHTLAPFVCAQQGPKAGPSIALDPGVGTLTINITDHSGQASTCQYNSDFVNRKFSLPANGTTPLKVTPAVPLFIDHQVDIVCDNGAEIHQPVFF
jgi:hypothetical protein